MARNGRSNDWGFPRWRPYGSSRETVAQRECDRHGCTEPGLCPAPKSPNSPDRWHFCQKHAAEYNKGWDYFEGLDKEQAAERKRTEQRDANAYTEAQHYGWSGSGDGTWSADELLALEVLELEPDTDFDTIKKAFRIRAKAVHPDVKPNDEEAAKEFQKIQVAYEVLKAGEDRRSWKGS